LQSNVSTAFFHYSERALNSKEGTAINVDPVSITAG